MTLFRPCIDLHDGRVKQIVGGSLDADNRAQENFVSTLGAAYYSELYRRDGLVGGHVIQLGPGNHAAALTALAAWPGGLQLGGGVTQENARDWLERGASKIIITSWLFEGGRLNSDRLGRLSELVPPAQVVFDLSCRRSGEGWFVATNRWRTLTSVAIEPATFERLAPHCSEFLVHAADVEGKQQGIDAELVRHLGESCPLPCTYAGGGRDISDLDRVEELSKGRVDLTFGSALDIFGGQAVRYQDCVAFNRSRGQLPTG